MLRQMLIAEHKAKTTSGKRQVNAVDKYS